MEAGTIPKKEMEGGKFKDNIAVLNSMYNLLRSGKKKNKKVFDFWFFGWGGNLFSR